MRGFTLIEVLIVLATVTIIAGIGIPIYYVSIVRTDGFTTTAHIAQTLRRAQSLSMAGVHDSAWGVRFADGVTLFKGSDFATRDSIYDESVAVPVTLTLSGVQEITYSKKTGIPDITGDILVTASDGTIYTISLNAYGTVSY